MITSATLTTVVEVPACGTPIADRVARLSSGMGET